MNTIEITTKFRIAMLEDICRGNNNLLLKGTYTPTTLLMLHNCISEMYILHMNTKQ